MAVTTKVEKNTVYAFLEGDIDHHSAKSMREKIDKEIEKARPSLLFLDFKKINFMDSSGIGLIMGRYKLIKALKGNLKIVNVSQRIERIIKLSGLYKLKNN